MSTKLSILLAEKFWFDYTRFISATLIFFCGLFGNIPRASNLEWHKDVLTFAPLLLIIFGGAHIIACFRAHKQMMQNSWSQRYAVKVSNGLLFPLAIASCHYFLRVLAISYTVGCKFAYSNCNSNTPMTEASRNALEVSLLQDNFYSFWLTRMPIYLLVGFVIGYAIFFSRKKALLRATPYPLSDAS